MNQLASLEDHQSVDTNDLIRALADFSGELIHIDGPDETVSISIR